MRKKKILFIGGSLNQSKMGHAVAQQLQDGYACYFTPFYADGIYDWLGKRGWLDFTVFGGRFRQMTDAYYAEHHLPVDYRGATHGPYDLYVTTSDLIMPQDLGDKKVVLIQEGMTDPENLMYHLVRWFKLPRYLASTSTNGLSQQYNYFCVASEGYRDFFIGKGIQPEKIVVTGIPNFDHAAQFCDNSFPYQNFILVATSDTRETFKLDYRQKFIKQALKIANGRLLIFKLHPNENIGRAAREIRQLAPRALIFSEGEIGEMIANCDVLITQYSTVVYIGLALGKEVHSYFDVNLLKKLTPIQNGGTSGQNIAQVCRTLLEGKLAPLAVHVVKPGFPVGVRSPVLSDGEGTQNKP